MPCWLVAPLGPLGLAGNLQENTQVYITNYRNNNRHLIKISWASHSQGGGVGLLLWFLHWHCVAYRWCMVHRRVRTPVPSAAACRAFPSVIPRDPCVVGVVKKRRGGSTSAGQCKILKKGKGKQTICKKYETCIYLDAVGGGGCGRGGLVACLLLFAAQWRRSKLLTTNQVVHVDLAQQKKKIWRVPQTAGPQRDPPPVLRPAPALTVVVGVVFCAFLGPCACTMLCVRMAFPSVRKSGFPML